MSIIKIKDADNSNVFLKTIGEGTQNNPYEIINAISDNELGKDAWGRAKTITDVSLFHGLWTYNVPISRWKEIFNGTIRVPTNATSLNGRLNIIPGPTLNDKTILQSFRNLRYKPNRGHLYSTAGYIINPTGNMIRDFGTFTSDSGVFFRVKSTGLYAVVATTVNSVYTEDEQLIDTTGIDLTKGNTYDIQFQWRGVGNYKFFINLQLVYEFEYLGTTSELSMFNPSNPIAFRTTNLGDNDPMQFGCVDVTSEGGDSNGLTYGSVGITSNTGEIPVTGFNEPIIAIRSKLTVAGLINTRDTLALLASAYADNKAIVRIWETSDFTAITANTQTWTDYGDGHLEYIVNDGNEDAGTMDFDTTKATLMFTSRVNQDATYSTSALFEGRTNIYITPGNMFIFTLHRETGGAMIGGITFEFAEEI